MTLAEIARSTSGKTAIQVAKEVALGAGEILMERFNQVREVSFKGRANIVTDVDTEVESHILAALSREFPDMGLLGEESLGVRADVGYAWIVDPLDGTRNYASGIPFFSMVVGLALDGEVLVGVNYETVRREMFHAERGVGAFVNDDPISVSEKATIEESVLGMNLSYNDEGAVNGLGVIRCAPSMTWLLVRMWPCSSRITPVPTPVPGSGWLNCPIPMISVTI